MNLAQNYIDNAGHREAERLLTRGMEIDSLWGDGVELLMKVYAGTGELFKTLQVYRRYEMQMQNELGLDPDDSIKEQFNNLMAGKFI